MAAALCYGVRGGGAQRCFHVTAGSSDTDRLIEVLKELGGASWAARRPPCCGTGCPPTPAPRCATGSAPSGPGWWSSGCPPTRPEFNPVEGLWASRKAVELANLAVPTLAEVIEQAHQGVKRVRRTPHPAYSSLRHAGLSVS